jgi:hypothetical protein
MFTLYSPSNCVYIGIFANVKYFCRGKMSICKHCVPNYKLVNILWGKVYFSRIYLYTLSLLIFTFLIYGIN